MIDTEKSTFHTQDLLITFHMLISDMMSEEIPEEIQLAQQSFIIN